MELTRKLTREAIFNNGVSFGGSLLTNENSTKMNLLPNYRNFFATRQALWPPKPNELFAIASTSISRAWFGT